MDLTGKLLIAMPGMGDPRFTKSVVYMCAHSRDGAMGLIINQPAPGLSFDTMLDQLDIEKGSRFRNDPVHFGGPVENGRGFVLHSREYEGNESTMAVDADIAMTATIDILEDLARGEGPTECILALGYSGWGPGQLENEIVNNGWLTADGSPELVFDRDHAQKWQAALSTLGVSPLTLSADIGRA